MAKQVKSMRIDEELLSTFSEYSELLKEMFGYSLSLSTVVNEALAQFLTESTENWVNSMKSKSVIDHLPNGKIKHYEFTEEQIKKMEQICNDAGAMYYSYQQ